MDKDIEDMLYQNMKLLKQNTIDIAELKKHPLTPEKQKTLIKLKADRETLLESEEVLKKLAKMPTDDEVNRKLHTIIDEFDASSAALTSSNRKKLVLSEGQTKGPSLLARTNQNHSMQPHNPNRKLPKPD